MDLRGLKQATRACLRDSGAARWKLTLLFLLCLYAVTVPCDALSYLLEAEVARLSGLSAASSRSQFLLWVSLISLTASLFSSLWSVGYQALALGLSRGEAVSFRTLLAGLKRFDRFLILLLLESLYIFLWSMLFMVPGIVAAYRYRMAPFVLLDDPSRTPSEAIAASKRLTYGHKLELFCLDLSFLWYNLPLWLVAGLTIARDEGYLPALAGFRWELALALAGLLVPALMQLCFLAYVETTQAHAYNWLLRLDRERRRSIEHGSGAERA